MANETLRQMGRAVRLYNPAVPIGLAERWVNDRYLQVAEKLLWSFKIAESQFDTAAEYTTGTVTMTDGSAAVTGSGTTWTSAMAGRQFRVSGYVFTISTFSSTTSITLDRNWENATASGESYAIRSAYVTPSPSDFDSFYSVIDPVDQWSLRLGWDTKTLNHLDVDRSHTSSPRLLASRVYNSSDVAQYELWPHPTAQRTYPYLYEKRVARLAATETPPPIIRSDVLVRGALADLSRWPGTPEHPNPMADPNRLNWRMYDAEFKDELQQLMVQDQNIYLTNFQHKFGRFELAPLDAEFIRSHAF